MDSWTPKKITQKQTPMQGRGGGGVKPYGQPDHKRALFLHDSPIINPRTSSKTESALAHSGAPRPSSAQCIVDPAADRRDRRRESWTRASHSHQ